VAAIRPDSQAPAVEPIQSTGAKASPANSTRARPAALVSARPHELFVNLLERLYPLGTRGVVTGTLDPTGPAPLLEEGVRLGQNVVLASGVEIGRRPMRRDWPVGRESRTPSARGSFTS